MRTLITSVPVAIATAAFATLLAAPAAQASVVGFESDDFDVVLTPGETRAVEGLNFTLMAGAPESFFTSGLFDPATYVNNGSKTLTAFNAAGLSVAASNGNSFDLVSFELGGSFLGDPSAWASAVELVGHFEGGATMSRLLAPIGGLLDTISVDWFGLRSFDLIPRGTPGANGLGPDFGIDNLVLNGIPLPATLMLVLAGLAALRPHRAR